MIIDSTTRKRNPVVRPVLVQASMETIVPPVIAPEPVTAQHANPAQTERVTGLQVTDVKREERILVPSEPAAASPENVAISQVKVVGEADHDALNVSDCRALIEHRLTARLTGTPRAQRITRRFYQVAPEAQ